MATSSEQSHYTHIEIRCGGLLVAFGTETEYPDLVDDLAARTLTMFKESVAIAKENGIDITDMRLITADYGDDDDDE